MESILAAVIAISLGILNMSAGESDSSNMCRTRHGCNQYDVPSGGRHRVCRMHVFDDGWTGVEWHAGTLNSNTCPATVAHGVIEYCPGYVGMNMTLWCDFGNVSAVISKDGKDLTESATKIVNSVRKEDEGLYQCRRKDSGELLGEFNMTVRNQIHIGGGNLYQCASFNCDLFKGQKCCYYPFWYIYPDLGFSPFFLSIFGDAPISTSLSVEWITDSKYHYPTDLGVSLDRNLSKPTLWELNFNHTPQSVTDEDGSRLEVAIQVTASNNISSISACVNANFIVSHQINANVSLPQDVYATTGGSAVFYCEFGSNDVNPVNPPVLDFELSLPDKSSNGLLSTSCWQWNECTNWSPTHPSVDIEIRPIEIFNLATYKFYHYEIKLTNIAQKLNGSVFSCSISTFSHSRKGRPIYLTQWKGYASLYAAKLADATQSPKTYPSFMPISVVVSIFLVLAIIVFILVVIGVWRRKRLQNQCHEPAQVPLTGHPYQSASQSTLNSEAETPVVEHNRLPSISIMEVGGGYRDLIVGDVLQETRSMDSGVSCTEDYENTRKPPNSLPLTTSHYQRLMETTSPVRLCRSETDIADSDPAKSLPAANLRIPRKKLVVYISYTDHASRWVRSTLKPLIESWNIAEVMIPDRDMVAGKAVSNERRRLIVESDKIILVISPDYYDSEWCSYELMHAIQNEPTLSRGRIIPVLIGGCKRLPQNMEVVVPLFAHEQDFSSRLLAAIYSQPRLSQ